MKHKIGKSNKKYPKIKIRPLNCPVGMPPFKIGKPKGVILNPDAKLFIDK